MRFAQHIAHAWARWGLLYRIATVQGVLLLGGAVLITVLLTHQHRGDILQEQGVKANLLLAVAAPLVSEQILIGDLAAVRQILERQATVYPDVAQFRWMQGGVERMVVNQGHPAASPPGWFLHQIEMPVVSRSISLMLGGHAYGTLEITLEPSRAHQTLWRDFVYNLQLGFWAAIVLYIPLMVLLRVNLRTLRHLAESADRFRQGDYSARIQPAGASEMRSAALAFNNMAERLQVTLDDLSESRQQLREQLHFNEELIEAMPLPMFFKDIDGRYLGVNKAWEKFFGVSRETMLGHKVRDLYPHDPETAAFHEAMDAKLLYSPAVQVYEVQMHTWEGKERQAMFSKAPMTDADGKLYGMIGVITDLTELKHAEHVATQALVEKSAAEESSKAKSMFLANMSHEIRTPLNGILGLAQIGLRGSKGRQSYEVFQRILDSGHHLLGVINDILDFSKIEAGKLTLEQASFDLGDAIDRAVGITASRAYAKGVDFIITEPADLPHAVQGDAMRLTQILVNLLGNAIKFTEQGRVTLDLGYRDGALVFRVSDTGIGMSESQQQHLFQAFEQADSTTTRRFGGTGLGLALTRNLVELMGGEISVDSHLGEGSVFELQLPFPHGGDAAQTSPPVLKLAGLPLEEAAVLAGSLWERGCQVEIVADVLDALADPGQALVLLPSESLRETEVMEAALAVLRRGTHLLLSVTPGKSDSLPEDLHWSAHLIERPLRARHILNLHARLHESAAPVHRRQAQRLEGMRVLAAEDNEVNRLVLEDILQQEGAEVVFAIDGQQALDRIEAAGATAFNIVLMDIQMPVMDGYQASRHIRERHPGLPVLGLTAHAMAEERERCLAAGMRDRITKPIDVDKLVAAILQFAIAHGVRDMASGAGSVAADHHSPGQADAAQADAPHEATHTAQDPVAAQVADASALIDWQAIQERFSGRQPFINKLLTIALEAHGDCPMKLRAAAEAGDMKTLASLAHTYKGVAGNLMAHEVHRLCAETEASARSEQEAAGVLARQLADVIQAMQAEMAAHLQAAQ